jgi:hypothetical protein
VHPRECDAEARHWGGRASQRVKVRSSVVVEAEKAEGKWENQVDEGG